jgi:hypothetical protein
MTDLPAARREELLRRSWIANDAFWFYEVTRALGIEQANRLNGGVIRSFARLEIARVLRALGLAGIGSFGEYLRLFRVLADLFLTGTFVYEETVDGETQRLEVKKCFAYEGVARAGLAKDYHCGPGERALGWFEGLGLSVAVEPPVGRCQMAHGGTCRYAFRPVFKKD